MKIRMARGDMLSRSFVIRSRDGTAFTEQLDNIYLTVKRNENEHDYKFQKRLSDGGIYSLGEGRYQFTILPEDTDNMSYGKYMFDIELVIYGRLKRTYLGELWLTKEITHHYNEGA